MRLFAARNGAPPSSASCRRTGRQNRDYTDRVDRSVHPFTRSPAPSFRQETRPADRPAPCGQPERHGEGQLIRCFLPSNSSAPDDTDFHPIVHISTGTLPNFLSPAARCFPTRNDTGPQPVPCGQPERHGEGQRIIRCPSLIPDCFRTPGPHAAAPVRQWSGAYSSSLRWSCST